MEWNEIYCLHYREDGVYLEILPGAAARQDIDRVALIQQIKRKKIVGMELERVSLMLSALEAQEAKIAGPQEEVMLDEEALLEVAPGNLQAFVTLVPGEEGGAPLTAEKVEEFLAERKVVYGIDREKIARLVEERAFGRKELVAEGTSPQDGEDGSVTYYFSRTDSVENALDENGKIDFRRVSTFEKINEGQVLVKRVFATAGVDGSDVFGKRLAAQRGKEASFPGAGKNVGISEDRTELIAKIGGKVSMSMGKVTVLPNVTVPGDVDMSVGNVEFEGDVVIKGNVNQGFTVRCTGNLHICGSVEAAFLYSGGDITVEAGIKGADRGTVEAGKDVYALFMERVEVSAGGNIITGALVGCNVLCEGYVNVTADKGRLIGGKVSAGKYIVAKTIGSDAGIPTKLYIGALPKKKQRYTELEKEIHSITGNISRLGLAIKSQSATGKAKLDLVVALSKLQKEKEQMEEERAGIELLLTGAKDGNIHALDKILKGVKLAFGFDSFTVPYDNGYVTYYKEKKEILSMACQYHEERQDAKRV